MTIPQFHSIENKTEHENYLIDQNKANSKEVTTRQAPKKLNTTQQNTQSMITGTM